MLPSLLARDIQNGIKQFLVTGFEPSDDFVHGLMRRFVDARNAYSAIVVDETQDFGPQALRLLRAMIAADANDFFFVGDGHQRIYNRNRAAMSRCGIEIRGRSRKPYLNYRTTEEIRRQAVSWLEGCDIDDLDGGHDENRRYTSLSHGAAPLIVTEPALEAALARATALVAEWASSEETVLHAEDVSIPIRELQQDFKCGARRVEQGRVVEITRRGGPFGTIDTVEWPDSQRSRVLCARDWN